MIDPHAFNSRWWGSPTGIVRDPAALAAASTAEVDAAVAPFDWVELRAPAATCPHPRLLAERGFFAADTQIPFRIGLRAIASTPSLDPLTVRFADEQPFTVGADDILPFGAERFALLPGATNARIRERYALWAGELIEQDPALCLTVLQADRPQGYFLSRRAGGGLNLTLAMLRPDTTLTGMHLFHKALIAYAARGARVGHASFSATNTPVLNMYAHLGARFLGPERFFLRCKP